jgi:peptide/nickel transport system permease protein
MAADAPLDLPRRSPIQAAAMALTANLPTLIAAMVLALIILGAVFAPLLFTQDPAAMAPALRLKPATWEHWLGTDAYGRDLYSRIVYGGRVSLVVGIGAATVSVTIGLAVGLVSGFFRAVDAVVMRVIDGLMAIPNILLAIAVVALSGATLWTVLVAITIPEIPRVVRLVRSVVLSAREEPYVEAAIAAGTSLPRILWRHLMPNTLPALIVQGTYVCASAILTESILSFLGAGLSPEIPTWGNIIAEGRNYFLVKPTLILWPGLLVSLTVLSVNLLGDALRDALDPRMAKRG